jgi:hypothetical protein
MPYHVGAKGSSGCSGFPVVDDKGKVHGCHPTKSHANRQIQALYANDAAAKGMKVIENGLNFEKRDYSTSTRERMASSGTAMPDGSYPIANRRDLMNAIRSWGRGGAKEDVKRHIMSRARSLGAEDLIPENWKSTSKSIWSFNFKPRSY